ncbi:hypothetical protein [Acidithiobacillus ferriphilus]|nr:hypothetical protein [Acidithiobacillus ferriphilus]
MDNEPKPTPAGYRIEGVIEWLNVSYAELLEHGHRGELKLGINAITMPPLVVFREVDGEDCEVSSEELQRNGIEQPKKMDSMAAIVLKRKLLIHPNDIPILDTPRLLPTRMGYADGDRFFPATKPFYPLRFLPWPPEELPDGWYYMPPKHLQSDGPERPMLTDLLPGAPVRRQSIPVRLNDLIIPTAEIEKIRNRNYVAEKATADYVLGTKDKEKTQAIIAAMSQIIATAAPGYKHGDRPNAARIAEKIEETGLVDRKKETIAKEISAAWARFGR